MAETYLSKEGLPPEKDFAKLPRWARVAFAARCARRVQPLFRQSCPDEHNKRVQAVEAAIVFAEEAALHAMDMDSAKVARAARNAAYSVTGTGYKTSPSDAGLSAGSAAAAVSSRGPRSASNAASTAMYAIGKENSAWRSAALRSIVRDYELLKAAAEREQWDDETPVPPEFFGPLWPDGEPDDWPVESASPTFKGKPTFPEDEAALRLHFAIPAEMDRKEADRIIQDIIIAANELHLAYGGSGLNIADRIRVYEPALVPAGGDE